MLFGFRREGARTHEFERERAELLRVPHHPQVLEVRERDLVEVVLAVQGEHLVVHERDGPEFLDGFYDRATLLVHRLHLLSGLAFCSIR